MIAHQRDQHIGVGFAARHGDVEMLHPRPDIGDDLDHLAAAIGRGPVVGIDPHRHLVFADAVGLARHLELGAECRLEESRRDLGIREGRLLGRAAAGDLGILGCGARRRDADQGAAAMTAIRMASMPNWPSGRIMTP